MKNKYTDNIGEANRMIQVMEGEIRDQYHGKVFWACCTVFLLVIDLMDSQFVKGFINGLFNATP